MMPEDGEKSRSNLLVALQDFVRREAGKPPKPGDALPPPLQAASVVLLAVNLVLVLALVPEEFHENRIVRFGLKIVPGVLGGVLLAYFEAIRRTLFGWAARAPFRQAMVWTFIPLLSLHVFIGVLQLPVFVVAVRPNPDHAAVMLIGDVRTDIRADEGRRELRGLGFRAHQVVVAHSTAQGDFRDTVTILRRDLALAALARLPLLGRLFPQRPIPLEPRYEVDVPRGPSGGWLLARRQPPLSKWFWRRTGTPFHGYPRVHGDDARGMYVAFPLPDVGAPTSAQIFLPPGEYTFEFRSEGSCKVQRAEVGPGLKNTVDFAGLVASECTP